MASLMRSIYRQPQVEPETPAPFLCMRLMCSPNQDEVEAVKNELLSQGIAAETRPHPVAEELGLSGVELWVQDERDFFNAARLFARIQDRAAGRSEKPVANLPGETLEGSVGGHKPATKQSFAAQGGEHSLDSRPVSQPVQEERKPASPQPGKGIEGKVVPEGEVGGECAALRRKVEELRQALAQGQAASAREFESRTAAEKNFVDQISGLASLLERERGEWHRQLKSRDDSLKNAQKDFDSILRVLQVEQAAAVALKEKVVSLEMQRDDREKLLCQAHTEAEAERKGRVAAEERAKKTGQATEFLKRQLAEHKQREQQMQAHVASLNSLFGGTRADET